ncbi:AraC family transcriptional regulator [Paenibacillus mendelii]|uniref:AraC family transcriptional regulator n=1 Tax=Paenibacillus mendelii TaxID=206163 RepID=A0ABV6JFP9_9BACL|nr:AraC family transcriptional regulator [Paenibacillus mendelii]MCQ6557617.1 AraC family transcriptional regulator [Paenibacillus mendelii]
MNFNLSFLQFYLLRESTSVEYHKHSCYEIVYYKRGTGITHIDGKKYKYGPNTFSIIRPRSLHDERHIEDTDLLFIGFHYDEVPVELPNGVYNDAAHRPVQQIFERMRDEIVNKKSYHTLQLNLLGSQLMLEIGRTPGLKAASVEPDDRIQYARNFIKENYMQPIQLKTLAALSGYSTDRFRHVFKERTGLSPMNFLMMERIEHAKKLLAKPDLKIASIAIECGFSTASQFSALFKHETGVTPKEFRELPAPPIEEIVEEESVAWPERAASYELNGKWLASSLYNKPTIGTNI